MGVALGVALGVAMGVVCCEVIDSHTICPYYFAFQRYSVKPAFSVHPVLNTPEYVCTVLNTPSVWVAVSITSNLASQTLYIC